MRRLSKRWWRVPAAAQGAKAKQQGANFEDELEAQHTYWRSIGLASIMRAHPPVAGPPDRLRYDGPGGVDFVGMLAGRPIAFDAKSRTDRASFRYDDRDMHQALWLHDWQRQRGTAFVLVRDITRSIAYVVFDVASLSFGNAVQLREPDRRGGAPLVPVVEMAMFNPVTWNYLPLLEQRWTRGG